MALLSHGSVKVADCPCLLAADCVQSLIAFRRLVLEIWLSSERFRLCHDFDGALLFFPQGCSAVQKMIYWIQ
jgi:hypothetical protein